jgi:LmbE family N-acetylglucosaminyl deacetylase
MGSTARSLEAMAMGRLRSALFRRAQDATGQAAMRSCLVIAPHPDDETLGCGATMARKVAAKRRVNVMVCTDGRNSHRSALIPPNDLAQIREVECTEACRTLGVPKEDIEFLRYEDGHLSHRMDDLFHELTDAIAACKPDEIYSPSPIDRSPDHRAIAAVMDELVRRGVVSCPVLEYPIWFWTARAWARDAHGSPLSVLPTLLMPGRAANTLRPVAVSTDGFLDLKREALEKHKSQMTNLTGEPGWATLDANFLSHFFLPAEMFFTGRIAAGQRKAAG